MATTTDNIYTRIMKIRNDFSNAEIKKSGHNTFQHFKYLELVDFIPTAINLCCKYGVYTHIDVGLDGFATMVALNTDNPEEDVRYNLQLPPLTQTEYNKTLKMDLPKDATKQIQDLGKLETYVRRYLYMLFLDIAVPDTVDAGKTTKPKTSGHSGLSNKSTFGQIKKEKQTKREEKQRQQEEKTEYETQIMEDNHRPRPLQTDLQIDDPEPLRTYTNQIVTSLRNQGKKPIRKNIWIEATQKCKDGEIPSELKDDLQKYIMSHCPEELD